MTKKFIPLLLLLSVALLPGKTDMSTEQQHTPEKHKQHAYQHEGGQHKFDEIEKWVERFEKPEREEWQRPAEVIRSMGLQKDSRIADIGSATGYFPVRFAKAVPQGKVYGIDIEEGMVDYLNERANKEGLSNLKSLLGKPDNPNIPEPVDIVFICNTYHHIENRTDYFRRLRKDFRPGGRLVIVDFRKGELPVGPPDQMKLTFGQVISELGAAGYNLMQRSEVLPYQYLLIFRPGPGATDR
jgi:ubiquinone/menaquinone biosynthesis C-methylase UbiE|tara:strand:- start:125 stop:847 length:723 start_codon:yes stop_codon:yes gene_type:complete